jgi:hypothetical protein
LIFAGFARARSLFDKCRQSHISISPKELRWKITLKSPQVPLKGGLLQY